ncbi:MAG: hypothetical protein J7J91_08485 [Deltaproteobacteria bacterium]|nr:hypothetical protein [Deltaproteobacteria bacterium]MCD6138586.1 hypothetical protein [Deltaproteobacteria bacterium]
MLRGWYQVVVGDYLLSPARLDAPGMLPASPERSDGGQVLVGGIEERRIVDDRRHRDNSGSIGTCFLMVWREGNGCQKDVWQAL